MNSEVLELIDRAKHARKNAYVPYSGFKVGAAILSGSGEIFVGCNVENLSYGLTICAERNAIGAAIVAKQADIKGVVICADSEEAVSPCGACRQVLAEFGDPWLVSVNLEGAIFECNVSDLLPRARTGILDESEDG